MERLIVPAIIIAASLWALEYTGPLIPENPNFIFSAVLWFFIITSGLSFIARLLSLPFKRK